MYYFLSKRIQDKDIVSGDEIENGTIVDGDAMIEALGKYLPTDAKIKDDYDFAVLFTG